MFRKVSVLLLLAGIIIIIGDKVIVAQTAAVSGTVEMKKDDGTLTPVAGALIEVYRTDIATSSPAAKSGKNGQFVFAGLQLGGTFMFAVSAPGCAPQVVPGIRAGQEKILIKLDPGDGSKLSEKDARATAAGAIPTKADPKAPAPPELTAEQKKAQAEYEAKVKEVNEKNTKAAKANEIVTAALKAGNEAYQAKNYDLAIAKYQEGIDADPQFVGSAPIFHNNRGAALMSRAVDTYNKSVKLTDVAEKVAGLTSTRKDLLDSSADYVASWTISKNAAPADIVDKANYDATRMNCLRGARDTFKMAVRTEQVDPALIENAKVLLPEYLSVETDAAKKAEANLIFADLYRVVGDSDNAIAGYKKILETSPDDVDALAGAGLSLVNLGYINNDKAKLQEGANYLQKFAGLAPDSHKFKADAVALIESLKKEQNVTPQKVTTTPRKKP